MIAAGKESGKSTLDSRPVRRSATPMATRNRRLGPARRGKVRSGRGVPFLLAALRAQAAMAGNHELSRSGHCAGDPRANQKPLRQAQPHAGWTRCDAVYVDSEELLFCELADAGFAIATATPAAAERAVASKRAVGWIAVYGTQQSRVYVVVGQYPDAAGRLGRVSESYRGEAVDWRFRDGEAFEPNTILEHHRRFNVLIRFANSAAQGLSSGGLQTAAPYHAESDAGFVPHAS